MRVVRSCSLGSHVPGGGRSNAAAVSDDASRYEARSAAPTPSARRPTTTPAPNCWLPSSPTTPSDEELPADDDGAALQRRAAARRVVLPRVVAGRAAAAAAAVCVQADRDAILFLFKRGRVCACERCSFLYTAAPFSPIQRKTRNAVLVHVAMQNAKKKPNVRAASKQQSPPFEQSGRRPKAERDIWLREAA
jgi:hypothetical protein